MKTFKIYALALLTIASVTACKKGENDPGLSLKSRKGRLAREWKLSSGERTSSTTFSGITNTTMYTFDGSNQTVSASGLSNTTPYTEEMTFEKDGSYKLVVIDDGNTTTQEGYWQFMGKSKEADIKGKEAITITITKIVDATGTTTVEGKTFWSASTVRFDKLSSKEIVVLIDTKTEQTGYSSTSTGTMTYTAE